MSHSWGWEVLPQDTKLGRGTRDPDGAWGYEGLQDTADMVPALGSAWEGLHMALFWLCVEVVMWGGLWRCW